MAHSGTEILFFLSFESFHISTVVLHLLHLYFCWQAHLILPEHLSSFTRSLIVRRGEGWFMVHSERSGRSTFHNLLWPESPSIHIYQRMFALFNCLGQFPLNRVGTKCKQKLLFLFCFYCLSHVSKHNHILVITTSHLQQWHCARAINWRGKKQLTKREESKYSDHGFITDSLLEASSIHYVCVVLALLSVHKTSLPFPLLTCHLSLCRSL